MLCVAKVVLNILKKINVDIDNIDDFLKERIEEPNIQVFKEMYQAINEENEDIELSYIE